MKESLRESKHLHPAAAESSSVHPLITPSSPIHPPNISQHSPPFIHHHRRRHCHHYLSIISPSSLPPSNIPHNSFIYPSSINSSPHFLSFSACFLSSFSSSAVFFSDISHGGAAQKSKTARLLCDSAPMAAADMCCWIVTPAAPAVSWMWLLLLSQLLVLKKQQRRHFASVFLDLPRPICCDMRRFFKVYVERGGWRREEEVGWLV